MEFFGSFWGTGDQKRPDDQTEAILAQHLDQDFIVFPMADAPQSISQVDAVIRNAGIPYPAEFLAHLSGRFPGIYVEAKEQIWPRPKMYDVGPFWSFLYGLHTYTTAIESEPWMRLDVAAEEFRSQTGLNAAPVLRIVGDADLYCVNKELELVQFRHETNELEPVQMGFWELLHSELKKLRNRKDQKKSVEERK